MSQATINLYASTWFKEGDSVNHSSDQWLYTEWKMDNYPNEFCRGTILQFEIPNTYKYKRITRAVVRYYIVDRFEGSTAGRYDRPGMRVAPYVCSNTALSQVTGANLDSLGQKGDLIVTEPYGAYNTTYYPRWVDADVTSFFSSNLYNGAYFSVILMGMPYLANTSQPQYYAGLIGGIGSGYAAQLILDYEDVTQLPPTPSYPSGISINENTDILFAWAWNSSTSAVQASVQLEYKLKSAENYTVVSLTQSAHTYNLAGGLPQGTYQWRIKGTNDAGETSGYSDVAEFNVVGKPTAPIINEVPNRTLTEITWNTTDQNAFDITLTDSSGKVLIDESVASSESLYKPNVFLKGSYTVGIRTRNSTGLMSDWSYKAFSITAAGPTKPNMTLFQDDTQVRILVDIAGGATYAVVRTEDRAGADEVILGYVSSEPFIDKTFGFGIPYKYVIRAYSTGGYTDSDPARICYHKSAVVLETDDDEIVIDRSEEKFLPYSEDIIGEMAVFNCIGRVLPVVEHGEYESREFRSRLYIDDDKKERLAAMSRKNRIFYRDYSGRAFSVAIQPPVNCTRYMDSGYIADIQFVRIAEQEVVVNV